MNRDNKTINTVSLYTGKAILVAAAYILASLLAILLTSAKNPAPLIWPQAGVALTSVLLVGFEALPGVLIGSILIAVATGVPIDLSVIIAAGNTLAAFFPAYFLLTKNNFSSMLENIGSILKLLLLGVVISPLIASTFSILGIYLVGINIGDSLLQIWGTRWLRDALGVLVFTPFFLVWLGNPLPKINSRNLIDGAAITAVGVALELLIFFGKLNQETANAITFLIIPIIIWASIRLSIHGLVVTNFISSVLFLWGIANKKGALFHGEMTTSFPAFLSVLGTMWATSLILSASIAKYNKIQKNLSDLSNHDTLTGLFNRLFFETEMKRLDNSRQFPISIIMSDLDNLKEINDTFGHRSGDQLLKNLSTLFLSLFRHEDIICRIGGDEFVALLPGTSAPKVKMIIERLIKRIDSYNHDHPDLPIRISLGFSTASQGESLLGHLKIADNLMYEEKARKKAEDHIPIYFTTERPARK